MKTLIRQSQRMILLLLLVFYLSGMTGCAAKTVVIPDSREIKTLEKGSEPMPGWFAISGGYLRDLFRDCGKSK